MIPRPRALAASVFLTLGFLSAASGFGAEPVDATALHSAPGVLIDLGGHVLHLHAMGEEHAGPTVILESGASGMVPTWAWIQPHVAAHARVVSYDRPGFGWSDPLPGDAYDAVSIAHALHDALQLAGIPGPFVLVGHSMGGLYVRVFADLYREEVAGMVLIDASHPDQDQALTPEERDLNRQRRAMMAMAGELARQGNWALSEGLRETVRSLPPSVADIMGDFVYDLGYLDAVAREMRAWDEILAQAGVTGDLDDLPLQVVIAGHHPDGEMSVFRRLNMELASLSSRGAYVLVSDADHFSIVLDEHDARHAVRAVEDVLADLRAR